jgi:hypothetical protein
MARYQIPPDPRDSDSSLTEKRPRRQRRDSQQPIPWRWLGLGVVVTIIGIGLAFALANALLSRPPLSAGPLEPTVIVLTAPPSPTPSTTPAVATPTSIPTLTPMPTPDVAVAPEEVTTGYYARVVNTDGIGVTIRGGPSINNVYLTVAPEGSVLYVMDGPETGGDFLWWQVRLDDGTEGWAAADYLEPAAAPEN